MEFNDGQVALNLETKGYKKAPPKYPGFSKLKTTASVAEADTIAGWIVLDLIPPAYSTAALFVLGIHEKQEALLLRQQLAVVTQNLTASLADVNHQKRLVDEAKLIIASGNAKVEQARKERDEFEKKVKHMEQLQHDLQKLRDHLGKVQVEAILGIPPSAPVTGR